MDDTKIVDLYLSRDESAIARTADKYGKRLYSLAYSITDDKQSAEECENDTYMKAWDTIPPNEPRDYLYAFLGRITRHIALNLCRDRKRLKRSALICELDTEMDECIPSPDDTECRVDSIVLGDTINGFLGELDKQKRNIFVRRYWFLDSVENIAKRYSVSEAKVKSVLFRCRKKLREHLIKEGFNL